MAKEQGMGIHQSDHDHGLPDELEICRRRDTSKEQKRKMMCEFKESN